MGSTCLKGKGGFGGFSPPLFEWHIFNRNVFDSCVDNISLETSLHWLFRDVVNFKIRVGFTRNLQKCNSDFTKKNHAYSSNRDTLFAANLSLQMTHWTR